MGGTLRSLRAALALALCTAVLPASALAAGDTNKTQCGPETESSPGFRTYLPDCRAYELVTPPDKGGAVLVEQEHFGVIAPDGAHVMVGAGGAFAGTGNLWFQPNRNPSIAVYELSRTASGWTPTALTPSATIYPYGALLAASDEDLGVGLWSLATTNLVFNEDIFLGDSAGDFVRVGPGVGPEVAGEALNVAGEELTLVGASKNLTRSLYQVEASSANTRASHGGHSNLWPGDTTEAEAQSLYEYVYGGAVDSEPALVGVKNESQLRSNAEAQLISRCGTEVGSGAGHSMYNAVSEDGETVFFTARACRGGPAVNELYARIGSSKTVPISEPSKTDCGNCNTSAALTDATFEGASRNGDRAFFLTSQELLPGQRGENLYQYDFKSPAASGERPSGRISLLSGGSSSPGVQGVVRVSEDGSHVYFVAKGVLAGKNGEGREPQAGADNLYVYEADPARPGGFHTVFVATLLTPAEEAALEAEEAEEASKIEELAEKAAVRAFEEALASGASEEEASEASGEIRRQQERMLRGTLGPSGTLGEDVSLWQTSDSRPAQATPDGRFMVFVSSGDLTRGDESRAPQLFEYDAVDETLSRTSIGQGETFNKDGNVETFHDAAAIPPESFASRALPTGAESGLAISEDGSRVFFDSAAGLTPEAETGPVSVYEYHNGNVYLISDGRDASSVNHEATVRLLGIDPSGQDVFFTTADQLVPQDGETQMALFDAREEGGFPAPVFAPGCSGETCRGASGTTPQLPPPGTATQIGGDNLPPPAESKSATKPKQKALTRAQKLAEALRACKRHRSKKRRTACDRQARQKYGVKARPKKHAGRSR